jgi:hypothetical protein
VSVGGEGAQSFKKKETTPRNYFPVPTLVVPTDCTYFAIVRARGHKVTVAVKADARDALRVLATCCWRRAVSREGDQRATEKSHRVPFARTYLLVHFRLCAIDGVEHMKCAKVRAEDDELDGSEMGEKRDMGWVRTENAPRLNRELSRRWLTAASMAFVPWWTLHR